CFFFQAEDGIRDRTVTGVQTCALPISLVVPVRPAAADRRDAAPGRADRPGGPRLGDRHGEAAIVRRGVFAGAGPLAGDPGAPGRSEERRVGKECRSWWGR